MSADDVVSRHGWEGMHVFASAAEQLTDVYVDRAEEEICMSIDPSCRDALLVVDWDEDDVDIKLGVLAVPGAEAHVFDLTVSDVAIQKQSEMYTVPRIICEGASTERSIPAVALLRCSALCRRIASSLRLAHPRPPCPSQAGSPSAA